MNCKHKQYMQATNLLVVVEVCDKYGAFVSNNACVHCEHQCGGDPPPENDFPRRPESDLADISITCRSCPLFDNGYCSINTDGLPIETWSTNPAHHCPTDKW